MNLYSSNLGKSFARKHIIAQLLCPGADTEVALLESASRDRERASRQNIVATLRLRIKNLEEKNRELTGLLELVYGELALAREQKASVGTVP
jgi:hypothetical protein